MLEELQRGSENSRVADQIMNMSHAISLRDPAE